MQWQRNYKRSELTFFVRHNFIALQLCFFDDHACWLKWLIWNHVAAARILNDYSAYLNQSRAIIPLPSFVFGGLRQGRPGSSTGMRQCPPGYNYLAKPRPGPRPRPIIIRLHNYQQKDIIIYEDRAGRGKLQYRGSPSLLKYRNSKYCEVMLDLYKLGLKPALLFPARLTIKAKREVGNLSSVDEAKVLVASLHTSVNQHVYSAACYDCLLECITVEAVFSFLTALFDCVDFFSTWSVCCLIKFVIGPCINGRLFLLLLV